MKKIYIAACIIVLVALVFFIIPEENKKIIDSEINVTFADNNTSNENYSKPDSEISGIDLKELSTHNTKQNCWVVYKNKVYDISSFIPNHPGGESPIARTCGTTNFEQAFQRQHGTSKANMFMKVTTYKGEYVI